MSSGHVLKISIDYQVFPTKQSRLIKYAGFFNTMFKPEVLWYFRNSTMGTRDMVKLNVGGRVFHTTRSTLTKYDSFFKIMIESEMFNLDESGSIFIDRSPKQFDLVLNFLRDGDVPIPDSAFKKKLLLKEAEYYMFDGLIDLCGGVTSEMWNKEEERKRRDEEWKYKHIRLTSNVKEFQGFKKYSRNQFAVLISYNEKEWGSIHENRVVENFVRNHRHHWKILFFHCESSPAHFIINVPNYDSWQCHMGIGRKLEADAFFRQVERVLRNKFGE